VEDEPGQHGRKHAFEVQPQHAQPGTGPQVEQAGQRERRHLRKQGLCQRRGGTEQQRRDEPGQDCRLHGQADDQISRTRS
jgi:hypothetical protein